MYRQKGLYSIHYFSFSLSMYISLSLSVGPPNTRGTIYLDNDDVYCIAILGYLDMQHVHYNDHNTIFVITPMCTPMELCSVV